MKDSISGDVKSKRVITKQISRGSKLDAKVL
jgi:hypothetical protein